MKRDGPGLFLSLFVLGGLLVLATFFAHKAVVSEFTRLMKQPEYVEGPEALENFEKFATAILQAPPKKKKKQVRKPASQEKRGNPTRICVTSLLPFSGLSQRIR